MSSRWSSSRSPSPSLERSSSRCRCPVSAEPTSTPSAARRCSTRHPHERQIEYPLICGHENVGRVAAIGGEVLDSEGRRLAARRPHRPGGERQLRTVLVLPERPAVLHVRTHGGLRQQPELCRARRICSAAGASTCTCSPDAAVSRAGGSPGSRRCADRADGRHTRLRPRAPAERHLCRDGRRVRRRPARDVPCDQGAADGRRQADRHRPLPVAARARSGLRSQ